MNSAVFRVRRRFTERRRVAIGVYWLISIGVGWPNVWWRWLIFILLTIGLILYLIFDGLIPLQMSLMTTHLQIGKVSLTPDHIERIQVDLFHKQVTIVSPLDDRDIRNPHQPMMRIRPLEDFQEFYRELEIWAKEQGILCEIVTSK